MSLLARLERLERRFSRPRGPLPFGFVVSVAATGEQPATVRELSRTWPPLLLRTWERLDSEDADAFIARVRADTADGALLVSP